jgi:quercetin dioxygenase-like cupin family protein
MSRPAMFSGLTAGLVAAAFVTLAAQQPAFKRTILQQADISAPGREAITARAEFPAGSETGRHTHPGEEISYVEEGPLVLEVDGQPTRTLKTGEVFIVAAGIVHNAKPAGASAKVIANYIVEKGKPTTSPAPAR